MELPGLQVKDSNGRIMVQYMDVFQLDLSALISRIFDHALGPQVVQKSDNVIPIDFKEKENGNPRRPNPTT